MMRHLLLAVLLALSAAPASAETVRVAPQEQGAHRTIAAAIDALPPFGGEVRIAPGTYREKLWISKPNVHLVGEGAGPEGVVLVYGDSSVNVGNTYATPSVYAAADGFRADNLTIANDWGTRPGEENSQAVALAISGDKAVLTRVRILGRQDTLYLSQPPNQVSRHVFRDCYIEGHVDFVFGNAKAYFQRCELHGVARSNIFYTAQSRNGPEEDSAFVFSDCRLTAESAPDGVWLGRAWRPYARVVWLNTRMDAPIAPAGWREWYPDRSRTLDTAWYAEHRSTGPGASPETRDPRSHQLTDQEAQQWTLASFFAGDIGWIDPSHE
ncbi:pectinesterase family protein (plasmid) [Croceibacterium sp. TMG7-5b_MA50]|uniref:pectinesterase family protein n=1 Tax=Croceibacterium sp. TMG7-5b_MA50 TaxID=3121290 RepID=UPI003221480A